MQLVAAAAAQQPSYPATQGPAPLGCLLTTGGASEAGRSSPSCRGRATDNVVEREMLKIWVTVDDVIETAQVVACRIGNFGHRDEVGDNVGRHRFSFRIEGVCNPAIVMINMECAEIWCDPLMPLSQVAAGGGAVDARPLQPRRSSGTNR